MCKRCARDESRNPDEREPRPFPREAVEGREEEEDAPSCPPLGQKMGQWLCHAGLASLSQHQCAHARLFRAAWMWCALAFPGNFTFVEMSMHILKRCVWELMNHIFCQRLQTPN